MRRIDVTNSTLEERNRSLGEFTIIERSFPHDSPLHDFPYDARYARECPRRLLASPYKGCIFRCIYCYANLKPFNPINRNEIIVFTDYVEKALNQIDRLRIIFPVYFSQDHDPFAPIEAIYKINLTLMEELVNRTLPFEFITKSSSRLLSKALDIVNGYKYFFAQFTITTLRRDLQRILEPFAGSIDGRLKYVREYAEAGLPVVVRIDPILPYVNDDINELQELISLVSDYGARHIITSVLDIDLYIWESLRKFFMKHGMDDIIKKYIDLYFIKGDVIKGYINADIKYRYILFKKIREITKKNNVTFALCQEFKIEHVNGRKVLKSLNDELMTSKYCEGIPLNPVLRIGNELKRIDCVGDCRRCSLNPPVCGISMLKGGYRIRIKDFYIREEGAEETSE